jgi:hypothetical protein
LDGWFRVIYSLLRQTKPTLECGRP